MSERWPTNCQQEPGYPGADTVVMSIRFPDLTCHYPAPDCRIQEPHQVAECGRFAEPAR
jgi:hypothetical protein